MSRISNYKLENMIDSDLVGKTIHRRIDLQFQGGGSDKVYICYAYESQVRDRNGNVSTVYIAKGYYGRRGASLSENPLGTFNDAFSAIRAAEAQAKKKESGWGSSRYTRVNDEHGTPQAQAMTQVSQGNLDISKTKIPGFAFVGGFESYLTDPNYVIERVDGMKFLYIFVHAQGANVFKRDTGEFVKSISLSVPKLSNRGHSQHVGVIFEAYMNGADYSYAITDLIQYPKIADIEERPWKVRRAMLTQIMGELFPKSDLYSPKLPIYLNDYWYDDKEIAYQGLKGIVVAKDINGAYDNSWFVTTKV